jgi:hypothetical protein
MPLLCAMVGMVLLYLSVGNKVLFSTPSVPQSTIVKSLTARHFFAGPNFLKLRVPEKKLELKYQALHLSSSFLLPLAFSCFVRRKKYKNGRCKNLNFEKPHTFFENLGKHINNNPQS